MSFIKRNGLDIPDDKFLFFIPSPRDIPEVRKPIEDVLYGKYDVIWFKYFREIAAYEKAREYFLAHENKYEYFVIIPDDMIINQQGFDELMSELRNPSPPDIDRYPVLAGTCNHGMLNEDEKNTLAASDWVISDHVRKTEYQYWKGFLKFDDLAKVPNKIFQCSYIGFSFMFIHRSVIEKIPFRVDDPLKQTAGVDNFFSDDLLDAKIPQYIDKNARFLHLRGLSATMLPGTIVNPDIIHVGKYKPFIILKNRS